MKSLTVKAEVVKLEWEVETKTNRQIERIRLLYVYRNVNRAAHTPAKSCTFIFLTDFFFFTFDLFISWTRFQASLFKHPELDRQVGSQLSEV